jgi:hypothetical protein
MTLKQEIEATIQAYEEACKPENLNIEYCWRNNIQSGLCFYSECIKFNYLLSALYIDFTFDYLCTTPCRLDAGEEYLLHNNYNIECNTILEAHKTRIQYLKNLLNTLPNDSDN